MKSKQRWRSRVLIGGEIVVVVTQGGECEIKIIFTEGEIIFTKDEGELVDECASTMSRDADSLTIDVYHKSVISLNPFIYFHPHKVYVTRLEVPNMDFKDFNTYLQKLINNRCQMCIIVLKIGPL